MSSPRLIDRLSSLPLILAGPLVRHTSAEEVSVWLALKAPRTVTLRVHEVEAGRVGEARLEGQAQTRAIGAHLHLVLIRASATEPTLEAGGVYGYDLEFTRVEDPEAPPESLDEACGARLSELVYAPLPLPSFRLPPTALEGARLLYGSCRKPHGHGRDALATADLLLARATLEERPQHLYMTGDQIYADDVGAPLMAVIMETATALMGGVEPLPTSPDEASLKPGRRRKLVTDRAKMTSTFCDSHLLRLGEFLAMYLLIWSEVLWPASLPAFSAVFEPSSFRPEWLRRTPFARLEGVRRTRGDLAAAYASDRHRLERFRETLPAVRRALANITTYMIFDDHDVTDDWYLNRRWAKKVLSRPLGRRLLSNGQAAYALCQGWGNTPSRYEAGPERALLDACEGWARGGFEAEGAKRIEALIGLPEPTRTMPGLDRDLSQSCRWDFRVFSPSFEVWVLDTRTWRGFPRRRSRGIPDLISGQGWSQLEEPPRERSEVTLIIAPTNIIDVPLNTQLSRVIGRLISPFASDYGDTWESQTIAFERLLGRLATLSGARAQRPFVFLSGDVHYAFATRIQYWATHPYGEAPRDEPMNVVLGQLTSSPLKNQNLMTRFLHLGGYWPSFPDPSAWGGWHQQPWLRTGSFRGRMKRFYQGFKRRSVRHDPPLINLENLPREIVVETNPDWRYRVDFLRGERLDGASGREGRDIVGRNNLAEVRLSPDAVSQRLWWCVSRRAKPAELTRMTLSLRKDHPDFPCPLFPAEEALE